MVATISPESRRVPRRPALAALLLAALLAGASGCGGGGGSGGGGGGGGGGGPVTLLSDDFTGSFAETWQDLSPFGGQATSRAPEPLGTLPHGNPSPGLLLHGDTHAASGAARTLETFSTAELTIAFDARRVAGRADQDLMILVRELNTHTARAYLQIWDTSVRYTLRPGITDNGVSHTITPDGAFHRFTLTIDASGQAAWYRDGLLQQSLGSLPIEDVYLEVQGPSCIAPDPGTAHFDNLLITTP